MPISEYDGKTFVAFIDISGFKELMRKGVAHKALNDFYDAGYKTLNKYNRTTMQNGIRVEGFFISDCGILFVNNAQTSLNEADNLKSILEVIREINEIMIEKDIMLTTSIAYGDFKYQERIEFEGIDKTLIMGNAYLNAFLDNENANPKIKPGQCRLVKKNLPDISVEGRFERLCKSDRNNKHYYYYWMVSTPDEIESFESKYKDTYNLKYAGMIDALKWARGHSTS